MKDKEGTELQFGDSVRTTDAPVKIYRFSNEVWKDRRCYGVFINSQTGRVFLSTLPDGTVQNVVRVVADADRKVFTKGDWVRDNSDGKMAIVCNCCGSPAAVRSMVDDIGIKENRFCYFCGAYMGG